MRKFEVKNILKIILYLRKTKFSFKNATEIIIRLNTLNGNHNSANI